MKTNKNSSMNFYDNRYYLVFDICINMSDSTELNQICLMKAVIATHYTSS